MPRSGRRRLPRPPSDRRFRWARSRLPPSRRLLLGRRQGRNPPGAPIRRLARRKPRRGPPTGPHPAGPPDPSPPPPQAAPRPATPKAPSKATPAKTTAATGNDGGSWVRTVLFSLMAAGISYYGITLLFGAPTPKPT